jgi:hypothetical protein
MMEDINSNYLGRDDEERPRYCAVKSGGKSWPA